MIWLIKNHQRGGWPKIKRYANAERNIAVFLSPLQVRKFLMKSMIHNSLKEMKELGARVMEIERIRYRLRRKNAPKEAFQDLDRWHWAELALDKKLFRKFIWSAVLTLLFICVGFTNGVIAMIYFRAEGISSVIGFWNALCSFLLLYIGNRKIMG